MKNLLVATIVTLLLATVAWAGTVFTPGSTTDDIGSADAAWDVGYFRSISFEGTTANAYEGLLTSTDPTADRAWYLPDYDGYLLISISDDHEPQTADAVWFDSGSFVFEGATADAHETSVTVTDPTADNTVTIPDAGGTVTLTSASSHDYSAGTDAWVMTTDEAGATLFTVTNAGGAADATFPAALAGKIFVVYNNSGAAITFKVSGQTGSAVTDGKYAIFVHSATDCVEIYEQP